MNDSLEKAIMIIVQVAQPDKIILFGSHTKGGDIYPDTGGHSGTIGSTADTATFSRKQRYH